MLAFKRSYCLYTNGQRSASAAANGGAPGAPHHLAGILGVDRKAEKLERFAKGYQARSVSSFRQLQGRRTGAVRHSLPSFF